MHSSRSRYRRKYSSSLSSSADELPSAPINRRRSQSPSAPPRSPLSLRRMRPPHPPPLEVPPAVVDKKRKEVEDARRDDLTVLVINLSLKATEKDIWQFFTKNAGKIRDIQLIKDSRSGKSKGIGYVEFHEAESVLKALNLTGQYIVNQPIRVQASQAEKNRAAKAAKQQQQELENQGPCKIYIGDLTEQLSYITPQELKQLFSPFGNVVDIEFPKDPYTERCRGFAFLEFSSALEAREAMAAMHGFELAGKTIKVGFAESSNIAASASCLSTATMMMMKSLKGEPPRSNNTKSSEFNEDENIIENGALTRAALNQKLQENFNSQIPLFTSAKAQLLAESADIATTVGGVAVDPSVALSLSKMFTKEEVDEDISILKEIQEDVETELSKFGQVVKVIVDKRDLDKGKVLVQFSKTSAALEAYNKLNGRFFGGHSIICQILKLSEFESQASAID